jgi:hypothetical protein
MEEDGFWGGLNCFTLKILDFYFILFYFFLGSVAATFLNTVRARITGRRVCDLPGLRGEDSSVDAHDTRRDYTAAAAGTPEGLPSSWNVCILLKICFVFSELIIHCYLHYKQILLIGPKG